MTTSITQKIGETFFAISQLGVTQFEKDFNHASVHGYFDAHWEVPIGSVIAYLLFCYFGIKVMDSQKPFGLKYPLAAWNLFFPHLASLACSELCLISSVNYSP